MRTSIALATILVGGPALVSGSALAQEPAVSLPDVVVTATRVPTAVGDVPAGVTVITRADIEAHGYNTLTDALAAVPGLHVSEAGGPGGQASVFIRGSNGNHVLVLRDGMPITDAAEATGAFNFGTDTLADVERIEVVRGPMAALYGSGAIGGVINLISRQGTTPGAHVEGDLAGGYPAAIRGSATVSGVSGPVDYALTAATQSLRGYDSIPQRETVYRGVPQGFRDRILTLNLGYTPVQGTRLSLLLRADTAYFGYDTLGFPTFDDANSNARTASLLGRIGGTTHLFDGRLESSLFVGHLQDDRRYQEPLMPADPNQVASDSRYHSYRTDVQWNNTLHLDDWVPTHALTRSALTFGYEYTGDTAKVRVNENFGGFPYTEAATASMDTQAGYAGLQTTVLDRLTLTGQVRGDRVGSLAPVTWRVGAVYDLVPLASHIKVAYGTGFRAPSLFERFGVDSSGYVGNPALQPERSQGWEAGWTTDLPLAGRPRFATVGATYFDQRVRNLIVGVFAPVDTNVNLGSAHMHGVETELTLRPFDWLDLHLAWTLLDTAGSDLPAGQPSQLLRRPQNQGALDVSIRPSARLRITGSVIYTGSAYDYLYDNSGDGAGYGVGQHGMLVNATATYTVTPRLDLYLNGTNLLDSRFEPVNGFQTPGPTILAGVRFRL